MQLQILIVHFQICTEAFYSSHVYIRDPLLVCTVVTTATHVACVNQTQSRLMRTVQCTVFPKWQSFYNMIRFQVLKATYITMAVFW